MDMRTDLGFSGELVASLFIIEVPATVEHGESVAEAGDIDRQLRDLQQAYKIPEKLAVSIIEGCCRKYVSQILNFALVAAKKNNEKEAAIWADRIAKYLLYVNKPVGGDATLFSDEVLQRLTNYYQSSFAEPSNDEERQQQTELIDRFERLIFMDENHVQPELGIAGLTRAASSLSDKSAAIAKDDKNWAWG